MSFRLEGTRSNRSAIGARVMIEAGGKRQERTVQSGSSFASQNELAARFGLGSADRIETVRAAPQRLPARRRKLFRHRSIL